MGRQSRPRESSFRIRRLIQERRIRYVKLGKPVRIPESALTAYVAEHTVPTARDERARYRKAA
ncbi:excisionase family DNA-binding protein [Streptomyces sp. NEAU-H3]|nr:excisionase family DNA-binding protein [Streptomyces sp. NEAU-H3]NJA55083.1 excisionase family DNA-binding protein [Streptomyces sp. NEAU-H3]